MLLLIQAERNLKALREEFEQYKKESVKWSIEDFIGIAESKGYKISKQKAQEALEHMISKHDAELGITWITIDYYLKIYGTLIKNKTNK